MYPSKDSAVLDRWGIMFGTGRLDRFVDVWMSLGKKCFRIKYFSWVRNRRSIFQVTQKGSSLVSWFIVVSIKNHLKKMWR